MAMSDEERAELGAQIKAKRERMFGTKRAAYEKAGVNPATWDKAEAGERLRGDRLRSVVLTLWPESEGDWKAIGTPVVSELTLASLAARIAELEAELSRLRQQGHSDVTREAGGGWT